MNIACIHLAFNKGFVVWDKETAGYSAILPARLASHPSVEPQDLAHLVHSRSWLCHNKIEPSITE